MFDVDSLIQTVGFVGICAIIFMETGVLIGFIFPGDTLLFTAGILAAAPHPIAPLWVMLILIPVSAALGDQCGFFIGRTLGKKALDTKSMKWIGPEALEKTNSFFDKYGPITVMFARFIGVVRTLTPVVAGISEMKHRTFTLWSIIGCTIWGAGIVALGYFLGGFPFIQRHMHIFILLGLATVVIPASWKLFDMQRQKKKKKSSKQSIR